jgi:hypothetical protein
MCWLGWVVVAENYWVFWNDFFGGIFFGWVGVVGYFLLGLLLGFFMRFCYIFLILD